MKIKQITSQSRRDFWAIYECESCGATEKSSGYDDKYFHDVVIPGMRCSACGEKAPDSYLPIATKYPEGQTV